MDTKGRKPKARKPASKKPAAAPKAKGASKRNQYDWECIEREYRAGQLSIRQISKEYGPTEGTIRARAKKHGWERDLSEQVRRETRAKLLRSELRTGDGGEFTDEQVVEEAANRALKVIEIHRADIKGGRQSVRALLDELLDCTVRQEPLGELIDAAMIAEDATEKRRQVVERAVSLQNRAQTAQALSNSLSKLVALERQAYNLDEQKSEKDPLDELLESVTDTSRGIDGYGSEPADAE